MLLTAAISGLLLIACAAVIYSLFYISVTGKVKEYGRLALAKYSQVCGRYSPCYGNNSYAVHIKTCTDCGTDGREPAP